MAIHDVIPEVDKCCFCFSIRVGSILIAICTLLSILSGGLAYSGAYCEVSPPYNYFMQLFLHIVLLLTLFMLFSAVVFLFGVCMDEPRTALLFLYAVFAYSIMMAIYFVFFVIGVLINITSSCRIPFVNLLNLGFFTALWCYFTCVIKSYYEDEA